MSPEITTDEVKGWSPNPTWVADHCPECAAAIGLVAMAWTRIEKQLAWAISNIMGDIRPMEEDGSYFQAANSEVAAAIEDARGNRTRVRLAADAMGILDGHPLAETWAELEKRLDDRARDRNEVVHAEWAWSERCPNEILRVFRDHLEGWVVQDFLARFERIKALEHDLHRFMTDVMAEIAAGKIPSGSTKAAAP